LKILWLDEAIKRKFGSGSAVVVVGFVPARYSCKIIDSIGVRVIRRVYAVMFPKYCISQLSAKPSESASP